MKTSGVQKGEWEGERREEGRVPQRATLVQSGRRRCRARELECLYLNTFGQRLGHGSQITAKVPCVAWDILIFKDNTATAVRHDTRDSLQFQH